MTELSPAIQVRTEREHNAVILVADGVLDGSTYRDFRDTIIKAALDEPRAVIVDVNRLSVPSPSAWSVFTSSRWHVSVWPDIPILLVCSNIHCSRGISASGVTRYVPVFPTRAAALDAADETALHSRRRARAELPRNQASIRVARAMIHEWLVTWSTGHLIPVAGTVATIFVENVLDHTDSAPVLIVENYQETVTVAVEDGSRHPATRREHGAYGTEVLSGLSIVSALSRAWGSTPTSSGKTVWALVGLENQL